MPKKHLGQHFLSDPAILERIVYFAGVSHNHRVLEVGPGRGALTRVLARRVSHVIAIEVDPDLAVELAASMPDNVTIVQEDALEIDFTSIVSGPYHVVANLPYNIATPLLERFVEARQHIQTVTVMLQKEIADRISASPGSKNYGPLSIGMQYYAEVERGFVVPPGAFSPRPKVHSRLVRFSWRTQVPDSPGLIEFVRKSFASRRKKLLNNLGVMFPRLDRTTLADVMEQQGLKADVRPERLSVEQFAALYEEISARSNR